MAALTFLGPLPATAPQAAPQSNSCDAIASTGQESPQRSRVSVCNLVISGQGLDSRWNKFQEPLKKFYSPDYALAWTDSGKPTAASRAMIDLVVHADTKGLEPEDYDGPGWSDRLRRFSDGDPAPAELASFDVALTLSAMHYLSDLHLGRATPQDGSINLAPKRLDLADFLRGNVVRAADVKSAVAQLEPAFARYQAMLKILAKYTDMNRRHPDWNLQLLPDIAFPVSPGRLYAGIPPMVERLREYGDLPANAQLPAQPDLYAGDMVSAVRHFQRRHGLADDGKITRETLAQLNVPLSLRISEIKLTLERWRWLPAGLHSFIEVNVPEFQLRAYADDAPMFTTKVIVGKAYQHHTPLFADEMEYVVFRPAWHVPVSIARKEIVPALQRNPDYLTRHRMDIVSAQGEVVSDGDADEDTLRQLRTGRFEVRQRPGAGNSLGLVKFVFPNSYDVYLHGTPEQKLFSRSRRDFSHGCIRVEDPAGLAAWVLRHDSSWTQERIQSAMYGERTFTVNLPQHIPVLIYYATAMVNDNGEVSFYPDIYKLDTGLERVVASLKP